MPVLIGERPAWLVALSLVAAVVAMPEAFAQSDFTLTSTAFRDGGAIPARLTCEGEDLSPPLAWHGMPAGTKSIALIVDDPDAPDPKAPKRVWTHWLLFNLSPEETQLPEDADRAGLPSGTARGVNDFGDAAYGGPCPPVGRHRYFHKLYALDTMLDLDRPNRARLEAAMRGHVIAEAKLVGTYQKGGG
jgi:Raf kinase inhibitor-like YbhB/YbcL family protein